MSTYPYIGEIMLWPVNFAPRGWAFCNGQLMAIDQNPALYSLIGNYYGGDGYTTFALPDLRGRAPIGAGQGYGLSYYAIGQQGGVETVALIQEQMPNHAHDVPPEGGPPQLRVSSRKADQDSPVGNYLAKTHEDIYAGSADSAMNSDAISGGGGASGSTGNAGGGQAHENRQPWLAVHYVISLDGTYPSRS